jgi:hypothetical protein
MAGSVGGAVIVSVGGTSTVLLDEELLHAKIVAIKVNALKAIFICLGAMISPSINSL